MNNEEKAKAIFNVHYQIEVGMNVTVEHNKNERIDAVITEIRKCDGGSHDYICNECCLRKLVGINGKKPCCMVYGSRTNGFRTGILIKDFISEDEFEI